ncbi:UDP-N-acetylmuramoylalanyl-D-glutamyl-2,6-diaminopimelate--D-alanyl-D-alanine ligase [Smithella sp. ME-1]|nr:UDP-N-acetylmuramoylalanyl-D-glutamyl-2,6-diaminopimelate--D-alanyl-D-alanine ligase [Smithella sp. ME-1]
MLTVADIFEALTYKRPTAPQIISEAAVDSRQVIPAALFVALKGEQQDGHLYVNDAFRRGAQAVLIEKQVESQYPIIDLRNNKLPDILPSFDQPVALLVINTLDALQKIAAFWRRRLNIRVIGITGSVGKSTTKELIAEVLSQKYRTLKNFGNLNNEIGLPLTIIRMTESHQRAVLEMGFYVPGEIKLLCEIADPITGVITNIGAVHAERAGSLEAIARGKAELIEYLPSTGTAILNYDDPMVRPMAEKTQANVLFYGLNPQAHLWADQIEGLGLQGIRFCLHYKNERLFLRVPLIGQHSVHTALRAAAVGLVEGLTWQEIVNGLQQGHTQLRLAAVTTPSGALILDDTYNASPDSVMAALNLLDELQGEKCAVLGDMLELGLYEEQGHEMVGVRAAQVVKRLITVGERAKIIAQTAKRSGLPGKAITSVDSVDEAIQVLQGTFKKNDVVLVKGSHGLHMEQIVYALEEEK